MRPCFSFKINLLKKDKTGCRIVEVLPDHFSLFIFTYILEVRYYVVSVSNRFKTKSWEDRLYKI